MIALDHALDELRRRLVRTAAEVEEEVAAAVRAVEDTDADAAREALDHVPAVNGLEVGLEEFAHQLLAVCRPVGSDLRQVIATLRVHQDITAIAGLAVNISARGRALAGLPPIDPPFDPARLGQRARTMLRDALSAFVRGDAALARRTIAQDAEMDRWRREAHAETSNLLRRFPDRTEGLMHYLAVVRDLERIADLACGIAEDAIYLREGRIVRHRAERLPQPQPA
jgi:phosphate transport system protein